MKTRHQSCVRAFLGFFSLLLGISAARPAMADLIYGFGPVSNNAVASSNTFGQYTVRVLGQGDSFDFGLGAVSVDPGYAMFVFQNSALQQSSITDVYFQDGTLFGISQIYATAGVYFSHPANPSDMPAGNLLNPDFVTTVNFSANSTPPAMANGVNTSSEAVGILFRLADYKTIDDLTGAISLALTSPASIWYDDSYSGNLRGTHIPGAPDGLRIGIHVQGFANGQSETFVNGPPTTTFGPLDATAPEPASLVLAALGCMGLVGSAARSRRTGRNN